MLGDSKHLELAGEDYRVLYSVGPLLGLAIEEHLEGGLVWDVKQPLQARDIEKSQYHV